MVGCIDSCCIWKIFTILCRHWDHQQGPLQAYSSHPLDSFWRLLFSMRMMFKTAIFHGEAVTNWQAAFPGIQVSPTEL
jgi:hypothetical protein